ncbi:MAG: glycosyltransferase family 2 protein [Hyphomicrobiales bacterium]
MIPMTQSPRNAGPVRQTVCLCMIVKNEAPVIARCLASVRPLITHWVIVDTGSTDGTQDIVRRELADLPGKLHERPWKDFAHNRSEALALARPHGDYSLVIDADDALELPAGTRLPLLSEDCYTLDIRDGALLYQRKQLVSNRLRWFYRGVLHEFIDSEGPHGTGHVEIVMRRNHDGARRRDPETYRRDAKILERALRSEADPFLKTRYTFYLAQSYRDCGEPEKAITHYLDRARLGGWQEEVFVSLYQAAKLKEQQGYPDHEVLAAYRAATLSLPTRAEAIHAAARFCRRKKLYEQGVEIARSGLGMPAPETALFAEPAVYVTGLLDEFAVNAYWAGQFSESLDACLKLLESGKLPSSEVPRVAGNARFARDKLASEGKTANLGRASSASYVLDHKLDVPPPPRRADAPAPRVLIAILAKQKEPALPLYLQCIEELDYPKSSIVLYIRTNNNLDNTEAILRDWVARVGKQYAAVEFDAADVEQRVESFGVHEWNATRFKVLGNIRNVSLQKTLEHGCDFYFVCDVDNFIRPCTLSELVDANLPVAAPLLRSVVANDPYSNYHAEIDDNGYYRECEQYFWILNRWVRGLFEMPVVHCTYLIRRDVIDRLTYVDGTNRHEYVIFSDSARKAGIPQYFDNRRIYGYLAFGEGASGHVAGSFDIARRLMAEEGASAGEIFSEIYRRKDWGEADDPTTPFYSGPGSRESAVVSGYVTAVADFLRSLGKPDVVDLGCGDFKVGAQIRPWCGRYVACDVVPDLIAFNRNAYSHLDVDFRVLDMAEDALPEGDVVFVRQVLQHLGNAAIARAVAKIAVRYKYLVLTEHVPEAADFAPNVDIVTGAGTRLQLGSGVVLTRAPFNLAAASERIICESPQLGGVIRTTVYTLPAAQR